ncbi:MAG: hypothetical protein KF699_02540 [Phycisphaeraceae bacterium]|nr:hypothetical protein [Phycisphaeraceae bacterium]MBX3406645.1 hypothetical protein [Phycisphaeraceae bacterium]
MPRKVTTSQPQDIKIHIPRRTLVKVVGTGGAVAPSVQSMIGDAKPDLKSAPVETKRDWKAHLGA